MTLASVVSLLLLLSVVVVLLFSVVVVDVLNVVVELENEVVGIVRLEEVVCEVVLL